MTGLVLVACAGALGVLVARFYQRQKHGAMGGAISKPKAMWLGLILYLWFCVCPLIALTPATPVNLQAILQPFTVNLFTRGAVELFLLGVTKSWRPVYGISHNLFSLALLLWLSLRTLVGPDEDALSMMVSNSASIPLLFTLGVSLVMETTHAVAFKRLVGAKTTGADAVWFANSSDPRFRRVNALTVINNGILSVLMTGSLLHLLART